MHVLVTGGAGFIGSYLVEHHLGLGHKVHVVDDLSTGSLDNIQPYLDHPSFRFDEADILTWPDLDKAAAWADRIFHMAAVVGMFRVLAEPIQVLATNIAGTERLLRAVHAGDWKPKVLVASSSEVYGPVNNGELREDSDLTLRSGAVIRWNYAISKLTDESFALSYARHHDLPITIVRLFNTVGPRQSGRYGMVVPRFVEQASTGQPITVYGDGTQSRCFCDVRDTAQMLDLLLDNPQSAGEIVNVGNDRQVSIQELAEIVLRRAESSSPIERSSYRQAYGEGYEDIHTRRPILDKVRALTGYKHRYTLEDTIDELLVQRQQKKPAIYAVS